MEGSKAASELRRMGVEVEHAASQFPSRLCVASCVMCVSKFIYEAIAYKIHMCRRPLIAHPIDMTTLRMPCVVCVHSALSLVTPLFVSPLVVVAISACWCVVSRAPTSTSASLLRCRHLHPSRCAHAHAVVSPHDVGPTCVLPHGTVSCLLSISPVASQRRPHACSPMQNAVSRPSQPLQTPHGHAAARPSRMPFDFACAHTRRVRVATSTAHRM